MSHERTDPATGQPADPGWLAPMASDVVHRLANQLTVILGYTDLVMHDLGPDHPSVPDLQVVRTSAESTRQLLEQLVALGRLSTSAPDVQIDLDG
jgi:signal transduction histidine kinase